MRPWSISLWMLLKHWSVEGDVVSEIGVKLVDFTGAPAMARDMNGKKQIQNHQLAGLQ